MLQPETLIHGRYLIVAQIGQGGMGAVYEAVDQRLRSRVALKQTTVAGEAMSRAFEREAQILAGVRHPSLPRVIDHFVEEAGQFLVMEYIPGQDLAAALRERDGPFPAEQALPWADEILDALEFLHGQSPPVIHRDIKPQNLKLTPRGEIVLLDFGLAKGSAAVPATAAADLPSLFGYTPQYAPLEQIQGGGTDARSDLYSLGATLYHLVTGAIPPDAVNRAAELLNGRPDPLVPAQELRPELPAPLGEALQQALGLRADQRFQSARAMRRALQQAVAQPPAPPAATGPTLVAAQPAPQPRIAPAPAPAPAAPPVATPVRARAERRLPCLWLAAGLLAAVLAAGALIWLALRPEAAPPADQPQPARTQGGQAPGAPTADPREADDAGAAPPAGTPITVEERILRLEGAIDSPGEQDAYSFTAEAGQTVFVWADSYDSGMEQIDVRLLDANGDELKSVCLGCGPLGAQPLRDGGRYTLVVGDASDPARGAYELRVSLVPAPLSFAVPLDVRIAGDAPGPGAGSIDLPGARRLFELEARAGQQIFVQTADYDERIAQVDIQLLDANGDAITSVCMGCGNMGVQTLAAGGRYTLAVGDDSDPSTGAFDIRVSAVPPPEERAVALPFTVEDGAIAAPGAKQAFRFEAAPGQQIVVSTQRYDEGMEQVDVVLLDPSGTEVQRVCMGCGDMGAVTLRAGGAYTLVVGDDDDPATGAYAIGVSGGQ